MIQPAKLKEYIAERNLYILLMLSNKKGCFSFCFLDITQSGQKSNSASVSIFHLYCLTSFQMFLNTSDNKHRHHQRVYFWHRSVFLGEVFLSTSFRDFSVRLERVEELWKNFQKFMCAFKTTFFSLGVLFSYQGLHGKGHSLKPSVDLLESQMGWQRL